jgi:hypothetical protein
MPGPRGITSIVWVDDLGASPAMVDPKTGIMYANAAMLKNMKPEHIKFIFWHEEGHLALQTSDELAVDDYAFKKYAKAKLPLSESVKVLCQVLHEDNPGHYYRMYEALERAKDYDRTVNHNKNV